MQSQLQLLQERKNEAVNAGDELVDKLLTQGAAAHQLDMQDQFWRGYLTREVQEDTIRAEVRTCVTEYMNQMAEAEGRGEVSAGDACLDAAVSEVLDVIEAEGRYVTGLAASSAEPQGTADSGAGTAAATTAATAAEATSAKATAAEATAATATVAGTATSSAEEAVGSAAGTATTAAATTATASSAEEAAGTAAGTAAATAPTATAAAVAELAATGTFTQEAQMQNLQTAWEIHHRQFDEILDDEGMQRAIEASFQN